MKWLFAFISILFCIQTTAQKNNYITGYLIDSVTHTPILLGSITNLNSHETVMTGKTGRFKLQVKERDIISYAAVGYHFDTLHMEHNWEQKDSLNIFAVPLSHDLGNVTVMSKSYSSYQMDSMERRKDLLHDMVSYKKPLFANANSGAGLGISIDRFSNHEKHKRKAIAFFESMEKQEYINYRYSASLVASHTGFKDENLRLFLQQSRPSYEWLRKNTGYEDILYYINEQLKKFSLQK